jgi:hypothetical protein
MEMFLSGLMKLLVDTQTQKFISFLPQLFELAFDQLAESFFANAFWSLHAVSVLRLGARKDEVEQPTWFWFVSNPLCWLRLLLHHLHHT